MSTTRSSDELPAVVIDTDIGDNVDDSLALALAARWPQIRLLGVTTVFGDTRARAEMAKRTLICAGRPDIGVYMDERFGSGEPPRPGPPLLYDPQWVDSLRGDELDLPGVSFLRTACRKATARRPLLVCCLGPLTNLAKLLWLWPHLTKRIRITAMAGAFGVEGPDTNVRLDPEAADMVLSSGAQVTLIPLDVTHRLKLAPQFFESWSRCRSPLAQLLAQQVYRWLELTQRPAVVAHDPLTFCLALQPRFGNFRRGRVRVNLHKGRKRGCVEFQQDPQGTVEVCVDADVDAVRRLLDERLW